MSELTPKDKRLSSQQTPRQEPARLLISPQRRRSWWARFFRLFYLRVARLRGKPQSIALGLAVGVFVGCFPFFGLQTVFGVVLATCFRASKIAAAAGTWVSNPLTSVPIYLFNYKVGQSILGGEERIDLTFDFDSFASFKELGFTFAATLLIGCLVVGIVCAIISYFVSFRLIERWRQRQKQRRWKKLRL